MPRGGKRPGSGRKKGSTNKLTSDVRQAIMEAFSILGGVEYLTKIATTDPKAFCALLGKLIPVKVAGDLFGGPLHNAFMSPESIRRRWKRSTSSRAGQSWYRPLQSSMRRLRSR
jgi:hypothetical protein